jgi:hypothetical protein
MSIELDGTLRVAEPDMGYNSIGVLCAIEIGGYLASPILNEVYRDSSKPQMSAAMDPGLSPSRSACYAQGGLGRSSPQNVQDNNRL